LFTPLPRGTKYDLILSNPPYVTSSELAQLSPEVRDHEPRLALDGGPDGLAFYRRIATEAGNFLLDGGQVIVEIGPTQAEAVQQLFRGNPHWDVGPILKDMGGRPRVVSARFTSAKSVSPAE
jgi:release factor glutamine methyltransferase